MFSMFDMDSSARPSLAGTFSLDGSFFILKMGAAQLQPDGTDKAPLLAEGCYRIGVNPEDSFLFCMMDLGHP